MFELKLHFRREADGSFRLRLANGFRLTFVGLAIFIAAAMLGAESISPVGVGLMVISLMAALFDESWAWHPASQRLERRIGLIFLYRHYVLDPQDIMAIELRRFGVGTAHRRLVRLNLEHGKTGTITLECHRLYPGDNLAEAAHAFAQALKCPLTELDA